MCGHERWREYGAFVVLDDLQLLLTHSTTCDNRALIKR